MLIKQKQKSKPLIAEGLYDSTVSSIKARPNEVNPKYIDLGLTPVGSELQIFKKVPASFEPGSPLRRDIETLLGRELTQTEATNGFDLNQVLGRSCQSMAFHKASAGGKVEAVVGMILPPTNPTPQPTIAA